MLTVPDAHQGLLGKTVSDLIGSDVQVQKDGSVVGTIKYVTDFTQFNAGNSEEQKGNYFPLHLTKTGTKMTIKTNGAAKPGKEDMPFDPDIILRIPSRDTTHTIEVDGKAVVTLNYAKATLRTE